MRIRKNVGTIKILLKILIIVNLCLSPSLFAEENISKFPTDKRYYSVQIKSFSEKSKNKAVELYKSLKKKNYLVYYQDKYIKKKKYIRVRVGIFKERSDAKVFGEKFKEKEGFDYYIDYAEVFVDNYKDQFLVITTPQSIVYKDKKKILELYGETSIKEARISPDGKYIVFSNNHNKIIKLNIDTKVVTVLRETGDDSDELLAPKPSWSTDGRYIAYLKYNGWELPTELWIMQADGKGDRCLVPYVKKKKLSIKSYKWHPKQNKILYVFGNTFGTVSVGGNLYLTDMHGNKQMVIEADTKKREEISWDFKVIKNLIYYKVAHFDDQFLHIKYTLHKLNINGI